MMTNTKLAKWADDLETTVHTLNKLCKTPDKSVQLCGLDLGERTVHVYSGIYALAVSLGMGDRIVVRHRRSSYMCWEHSFTHNGIKFYEIRRTITRGDEYVNED